MAPMRTLVSLAMRKTLLKTSGETFQQGLRFMQYAGLSPDRILVVMRPSGAYTLQFYSACDPRPTQLLISSFEAVLNTVVCVSRWRLESLEFYNVPFISIYTGLLETTIEAVLLRNCTFPGISTSNEATELLNALNRGNKGMFFEYGDDSLISRIRTEGQAERAEHAQLDQHDENPDVHCSGVPVRSLVALSIETVLLKTTDHMFLQGIDRINDLGLAPRRQTSQHSGRCLHIWSISIHTWKVRAIEFFGVRFHAQDTQMLHNSLEQLGVERVLLNNCLYPGITNRDEGRQLVTALKRTIDVKVGQTGSTKIRRLLQL